MEPTGSAPDDSRPAGNDVWSVRATEATARARLLVAECARHLAESRRRHADLQAAMESIAASRAALATAVVELTRGLRHSGASPEQVVIRMKALVDDASSGAPAADMRPLRDDVVTWAIDAYFAA